MKKPIQLTQTLILIISVILFAGCSKNLSRERATTLIRAQDEFKAPLELRVAVGKLWYDYRNIDRELDYLAPLKSAGLVSIRETGGQQSVWWKEYLIELTPKGIESAKSWVKTSESFQKPALDFGPASPDAMIYKVTLAQKELMQVTGIVTEIEHKTAKADFTWRWTPTAGAKIFPNKVPTANPKEAVAGFQLYDDGWRVAQLVLGADSLLGSLFGASSVTPPVASQQAATPLATPSSSPAQARKKCIANLFEIQGAKETWALVNKKLDGASTEGSEAVIEADMRKPPVCPSGGKYSYNRVGEAPTCSIPGHRYD